MSYGLYVGKNHTREGIAYLGGYGDEPSSHWLEIVPQHRYQSGATVTVGVTPAADMPGVLTEIPQVQETARHIRTSYSYYKGVPAPLTNGGLNEYGVAVRDIWSPSRRELIDMTPLDQSGPNYSDLARIVMQRAHSARGGVQLIGDLIAQHGYSTYGGNSHLIADAKEAWVVIECAGGQGLWAAERLDENTIRASRPGYIEAIPVTESNHPDFLYAPNLVSFALEQGWYQPGEVFNFNQIYGDRQGRWAGVAWIEDEMRKRAERPEKVDLHDVMWAVRTSKLTGDTAGYGQVVPLHDPTCSDLRYLWHTQIGAIAAPFVPVYMGIHNVPPEFRQHRYLTSGESSRFMDRRHSDTGDEHSASNVSQGVESTPSATQVFKRLLYLMLQDPQALLSEVTPVWTSLESRLAEDNTTVLKSASILLANGEDELARHLLNYFTNTELRHALDLAQDLSNGIAARLGTRFGITDTLDHQSFTQVW